MILIADTSGLIAAFNPLQPEHGPARTALRAAGLTVVTPLVLLEVEVVGRREIGRAAAHALLDWLLAQTGSDRIRVAAVTAEVLRTARSVQRRFADLSLDLTDAVNVAVAERFATNDVLTLDRRDFRAVAPLTHHQGFRLLPDDA